MKDFSRSRPKLWGSILFSFALHLLLLYLFQAHSSWFPAFPPPEKESTPWEMVSKSEFLKEAFSSLSKAESAPSEPQRICDSEHLKQEFAFLQVDPPKNEPEKFQPPCPFNPSKLLTCNKELAISLPPPVSSLELFSADLDLPTFEAPVLPSLQYTAEPLRQPEDLAFNESLCRPLREPAPQEIDFNGSSLPVPLLADETIQKRASVSIPQPPLPHFPSLDELDTSSYSDSFDLDIVCSPREDTEGYLFALTLIPRRDLCLPKIRQHYSFLIDRANSIQRERLIATKTAVLRALEDLDEEDTFNIVVFDSKMEKLFPVNRPVNPTSLLETKVFLDKIQLGSFFAPADLYNPLLLTLPTQVKEDEVYTTILLTDGENFSKKTAIQSILQTWTLQNRGKTALFSVAMGCDQQLACLDAASVFNKGRLYFSPTKRGLRRKLLKLMKNIHTPVAKNLTTKAISKSPATSIELLPKSHFLPNLYLDQPIVILGSCDSQEDFILFVQGRAKGRWFNIKKTISFINAKKGGFSLRKEWALSQAYHCYDLYTRDDNPDHLKKAQELLAPFDIEPAFQ